MNSQITFSPELHLSDPHASYWMRQVTVRLRREICWCRYQRGELPDMATSLLAPYSDRVQATLDQSRFFEEKQQFYREDVTARYLSDLLVDAPPVPNPASLMQGSFGWVIAALGLNDLESFVLALGLASAFDHTVGNVMANVMNDPPRIHPTLALTQKLWDQPDHLLSLVDPDHLLFRYGLLQIGSFTMMENAEIDWESPLSVPAVVANQLLFPESQLPIGLSKWEMTTVSVESLTETACVVTARLQASERHGGTVVPVLGSKDAAHAEGARVRSGALGREIVGLTRTAGNGDGQGHLTALMTLCWLKGVDLFVEAGA